MLFTSLDRYRDQGLLLLRAGTGILYMVLGGKKLLAGPEMWEKIGEAMGTLGIHFAPTFWGLMASGSEFFGGLLLTLGLLFRPALAFMVFTMFVAVTSTMAGGFDLYAFPLHMLILLAALIFIGPGKFSFDERWKR